MLCPQSRWIRSLKAFGWHVLSVDGHDLAGLTAAFAQAKTLTGAPTMILAKTIKGKGFPLWRTGLDGMARPQQRTMISRRGRSWPAALAEKEGK
ncbi:MAG: hypothetical protein ACLT9P_09065 [Evtepia gabavorous]